MRHTRIVALSVVTALAIMTVAFTGPALAGRHGMWNSTGEAITTRQAREVAAEYLVESGFGELTITEVMEFSNHFYAVAADPVTGDGAFELLVSRDGRAVHPEPTMMWNTEYDLMNGHGMNGNGADTSHRNMQGMMHEGSGQGMMGDGHSAGMMQGMITHGMMGSGEHSGMMQENMSQGMMGGSDRAGQHAMDPGQCPAMQGAGSWALPALAQPLDSEGSLTAAQQWLDANQPGNVASDPVAFPGYVTIHIETNGEITGMLSVQVSTGTVWAHTWHGELLAIDHGN